MRGFINGSQKISKSNAGYSSKKSGAGIGWLLSTTYGEGHSKGKKNQNNSKRGYCLLYGTNTHNTKSFKRPGAQDECMKIIYSYWDKIQYRQNNSVKYGQSHNQAVYYYNEQKSEMNTMV